MTYLAVTIAALLIALGQTFMKRGAIGAAGDHAHILDWQGLLETLFDPWTIAGLATGGIGAVLYIWVLRFLDFSKALPITSGLILSFTAAISWLYFKEALGVGRLCGIGLIFGGVLIVARS